MTPIAAAALEESIQHWRENLALAEAGDYLDMKFGPHNCALCREFIFEGCEDCPVFSKTGSRGCAGTPYSSVEDAYVGLFYDDVNADSDERRNNLIVACRNELELLVSLRPKDG